MSELLCIENIAWNKNNQYPDWLLNKGSTTKLFNDLYPNRLKNIVTGDFIRQIDIDEAEQLSVSCNIKVYIREVEMYIDDCLIISARTVLPIIYPVYEIIRNLGRTSIGTILFGNNFVRNDFEFALINNHFARRSLFTDGLQKLLLTEIFSCNPNAIDKKDI
jgi:chorismate-pyruvate lyase